MTENNLPFVSIIVPVYNGERDIAECIESLLNQDYPKDKYEIIIVDNNSKDCTAEIIKKYPVKYVLEDKIQSSYAARNTGAKAAKGEGLVFFDADQVVKQNYLINLLFGWEEKHFLVFAGRMIGLNSSATSIGRFWELEESTNEKNIRTGGYFSACLGGCCAVRKKIFDELGGFNSDLFSIGDFEFCLRLQKKYGQVIKVNFDAIIYHKERLSYKALLKREYRLSFGQYLIGCMYPEFKVNLLSAIIKPIKRTALGLGALSFCFINPFRKDKFKGKFISISFDIALCWVSLLAKLQCFFTKGKRIFPANW